jgi:TrmH family RNA methyltransferase
VSGSRSLITSRDNALLVKIRKLNAAPDAYRKLGVVWLEGDHLLGAALARGWRIDDALIAASHEHDAALQPLLQRAQHVRVVDDNLWSGLGSLASKTPIAGVAAWPGSQAIEPDLASVVLDRVQDAGNVGAILRSAAAFGFRQIAAITGTAALWSPKVLRAGMGAHFGLRLIEGVEAEALEALAVPWIPTRSHRGELLHRARLPFPCAWLLGHEGQGVGAALEARATHHVRIAQPGGEESLNVAAAAAICLHASAAAAAA